MPDSNANIPESNANIPESNANIPESNAKMLLKISRNLLFCLPSAYCWGVTTKYHPGK